MKTGLSRKMTDRVTGRVEEEAAAGTGIRAAPALRASRATEVLRRSTRVAAVTTRAGTSTSPAAGTRTARGRGTAPAPPPDTTSRQRRVNVEISRLSSILSLFYSQSRPLLLRNQLEILSSIWARLLLYRYLFNPSIVLFQKK